MFSHNREEIPVIPHFDVTSWDGQPGYTHVRDLKAMASLAVHAESKYSSQGRIFESGLAQGSEVVTSEGFSFCSGIILRNRTNGSFMFSHLEPSPDSFHDRLRTGYRDPVRWEDPHDAVLVYGSLSCPHFEIESLLLREFWGPATLRLVKAETGDTHWGLAYNGLMGRLALMRKKPDYSVFHYQLFPPVESGAGS